MKRLFPAAYATALLLPTLLFANTLDTQESGTSTLLNGASTNYQFNAQVGAPGVGRSSSTNYIYDHGMYWSEGAESALLALVQWATPQGRVGATETNDDSVFYLTLVPTGGGSAIRIPNDTAQTLTTNGDGTLDAIELSGVTPGTYDVYIKTNQHLRKKLSNVTFGTGTTTLNFTTADNAGPKGALRLKAGDINNSASAGVFGDNIVNAVDISTLLTVLDNADGTGNILRANLNQDVVVNAVDISLLLTNLDQNGE